MEKVKKWRFHLKDKGDFVLTGVDRYGREVHIPIQQENIQYVKLDTSYLQLNLKDKMVGYLLWFKDADMSKAIAPGESSQTTAEAIYHRCSLLHDGRGINVSLRICERS